MALRSILTIVEGIPLHCEVRSQSPALDIWHSKKSELFFLLTFLNQKLNRQNEINLIVSTGYYPV